MSLPQRLQPSAHNTIYQWCVRGVSLKGSAISDGSFNEITFRLRNNKTEISVTPNYGDPVVKTLGQVLSTDDEYKKYQPIFKKIWDMQFEIYRK